MSSATELPVNQYHIDPDEEKLIRLLYRAIPEEEIEELHELRRRGYGAYGLQFRGGNIYDLDTQLSVVTSYNNTRKDEAEVIAWFERAMLLA